MVGMVYRGQNENLLLVKSAPSGFNKEAKQNNRCTFNITRQVSTEVWLQYTCKNKEKFVFEVTTPLKKKNWIAVRMKLYKDATFFRKMLTDFSQ